MDTHLLLGFVAVSALAFLTPGPDWFVVLRRATTSRREGYVAAAGVLSGLVVHTTAAALGVAAVLVTSATVFTVLKVAGAAYLVWLGVRALRDSVRGAGSGSARRHRDATDKLSGSAVPGAPAAPALPAARVWRQACTANVLNPKAAMFFVAVLPQFVDPSGAVGRQVLALGVLNLGVGVVCYAVLVGVVRGLGSVVGGRRFRVVVDRVAGVALIALGGLLVTTERRTA